MVTTDRHGLRRSIFDEISSAALSLPSTAGMTDRYEHNGPLRVSVEGLELLEYGYLGYFSDLYDEPAGRTVMATTVRHVFRNPTLGQTSPSSFSSCTTLPPTDHRKHDGPSQAP